MITSCDARFAVYATGVDITANTIKGVGTGCWMESSKVPEEDKQDLGYT